MAIELFAMILEGMVSWGVGKILDVLVTCDCCEQVTKTQVGNQQENSLYCKNCGQEAIQFTNACPFTIGQNKEIGHVVAKLTGGFSLTDPGKKGFFKKQSKTTIYFYSAMRARDMLDKQFVVTGQILDFNTETMYTKRDQLFIPAYQDEVWHDNFAIPLRWRDIPEYVRDDRLFAIDLTIKSIHGDILYNYRRLEKLFNQQIPTDK